MVSHTKHLALILFLAYSLVTCEFNASETYSNLSSAFPQLAGLDFTQKIDGRYGGRNISRCCLQAVYESFDIVGGKVVFSSVNNKIAGGLSVEEFGKAQFPCGATYSDSHKTGAPSVQVTYPWCNSNCGGWTRSKNVNLGEWVQPFVGFILPATVFCLNVSTSIVQTGGVDTNLVT
jgi:hypothetical protein